MSIKKWADIDTFNTECYGNKKKAKKEKKNYKCRNIFSDIALHRVSQQSVQEMIGEKCQIRLLFNISAPS